MKPETYKALLKDLQKLQKTLVASQTETVRQDPTLMARMVRLHSEAEVGGRVDDFVATAVRKSTVLFLLRSVFVRVLEDLSILGIRRIRDDWGFAAFREVAPALGFQAYFRFIFRDLAVEFPALFSPGDDELPLPNEDGCRALWHLWHHPNRDGEHYVWNKDGFDSRFLGDLYQDLDSDIRKRYALLQTPRFVEEYILDHTLTPALAEFDPATLRDAGQTFRLLDPTCGSGHFLIGALHRLADFWRDCHALSEWEACERALESVWGCDINPHAVEIAEFRLVLEVVARTGVTDLAQLAQLRLNLRAMDSLIPWERATMQTDFFPARDRLDAYATPKQRRENASFLAKDFCVVVGNPPYITPKDFGKRDDYRAFWPDSCSGKYAMSAPFVERMFTIARVNGFIGQITANSFMKRGFGKKLVTTVFRRIDLTAVLDTSGAYIPGHGTPTVILLGRNRQPTADGVRAVLGKRGEPKRPAKPEEGLVWQAIATAGTTPDDSNPFVTVAALSRSELATHPWSLGGGAASDIRAAIELTKVRLMPDVASSVGYTTICGEDDAYIVSPEEALRLPSDLPLAGLVSGECVRDYHLEAPNKVIFPYFSMTGPALPNSDLLPGKYFWRIRSILSSRIFFGKTPAQRGMTWFEHAHRDTSRLSTPLSIAFAFVATHNQFALDRGGMVFKQSAPVVKLPPTSTLDEYFDLLGLLNSSTLGFWMKQVFHDKGNGGIGGGIAAEDWERFFEYDSTKLQQAPICSLDGTARAELARELDAAAEKRAACRPAAILASGNWLPTTLDAVLASARDRFAVHTGVMVALQEELDWLTYRSYGLSEPVPIVGPDAIEPLTPGHRPFEIVLARRDDEADEDEKSVWWVRHGHDRVTEIPHSYSAAHRARLQHRVELIESDARLALLETAPYKRRWQLPDWVADTKVAAESWLLDQLEKLFAPAGGATARGPLAEPKPYRLEEIVVAWSRDPKIAAVAGVWTGTGLSVDLTLVAEKLLRTNALPDNMNRVYSEEGLRKIEEWKRVWDLQEQEDVWENARAEATARGEPAPTRRLVDPDDPSRELDAIPLPRKFDKNDFTRAEFFSIRGKLNVPRERFIIFSDLSPNRFGWNGWRDRERALSQVEAFTIAESDPQYPAPLPTPEEPRRCGVTFGLWESLPDVRRWEAAEEHAELLALAREACRQPRCPCPVVDAWKSQILRGSVLADRSRRAKQKGTRGPTVSLAERAWVASLFQAGKELDLAGVWERHQGRLCEPPQTSLPTVSNAPVQLSMPTRSDAGAAERAPIGQAQLALVLDDLVASGDLETTGRGKKRRFQLVVRGGAS